MLLFFSLSLCSLCLIVTLSENGLMLFFSLSVICLWIYCVHIYTTDFQQQQNYAPCNANLIVSSLLFLSPEMMVMNLKL